MSQTINDAWDNVFLSLSHVGFIGTLLLVKIERDVNACKLFLFIQYLQ